MFRKDTEFLRATVSQEIRQVLAPDVDSPEASVRRVQILVPLSPKLYVSLEPDADRKFGTDRTYKMPVAPPGAALIVWLRPGQPIFAAAAEQFAELALTVEYHDRFPGGV